MEGGAARRAATSDETHRSGAPRRSEGGAARRAATSDETHQSGALRAPDWWSSYFDQHYLTEYEPLFDLARDRREVARLIAVLGLPSGARLLDLACGQGRHAHLLAEAGFDVDGVDYSREILAQAKRRGTARTLRYTRADMRRLPARWTGRFDAVVNLFTSFGFFADPADDARVVAEVARVLAPGGVFVFHAGSRDGVMARFLHRDWWRTGDGTVITQERRFDPLSGQLTIETSSAGPSAFPPREHRIRLYTASRIAELCAAAGLVVTDAYDGWRDRPLTRRSTEMLLVARKEPPVRPLARSRTRRQLPAARGSR